MKKTLVTIWLVTSGIAATVLFNLADEVKQIEKDLALTEARILKDREAIHVLRAEWSYLNRPERLVELSERYLQMEPMNGEDIGAYASLGPRPENMGQDPQARLVSANAIPPQRNNTIAFPTSQPTVALPVTAAAHSASAPAPTLAVQPAARQSTPALPVAKPTLLKHERTSPITTPATPVGLTINPVTGRPLPSSTRGN